MNLIPSDPRSICILEQLERKGSVTVTELAEELNVADITIRRDLSELEKFGYLKRVHGGAVNVRSRSVAPPLPLRMQQMKEAKAAIGRYAAAMISDGESVALDIGSTVLEIADCLMGRRNLTILTASIYIASNLMNYPDIQIILPGGVLRQGEGVLSGELAVQALQGYFVDKLFLGVGAIDSEAGLTEHNLDDALVKKVLIKNSKDVILVADSSKFEKISFGFIANLNEINQLITEQRPPEKLYTALKRAGVTIHVVSTEDETVKIL